MSHDKKNGFGRQPKAETSSVRHVLVRPQNIKSGFCAQVLFQNNHFNLPFWPFRAFSDQQKVSSGAPGPFHTKSSSKTILAASGKEEKEDRFGRFITGAPLLILRKRKLGRCDCRPAQFTEPAGSCPPTNNMGVKVTRNYTASGGLFNLIHRTNLPCCYLARTYDQ